MAARVGLVAFCPFRACYIQPCLAWSGMPRILPGAGEAVGQRLRLPCFCVCGAEHVDPTNSVGAAAGAAAATCRRSGGQAQLNTQTKLKKPPSESGREAHTTNQLVAPLAGLIGCVTLCFITHRMNRVPYARRLAHVDVEGHVALVSAVPLFSPSSDTRCRTLAPSSSSLKHPKNDDRDPVQMA